MVISLVHPHTCRFAKAAIWLFTKDVTDNIERNDNETPYPHCARGVQVIHERFGQMFTSKKFAVDVKMFQKKLSDLRKTFRIWNPRKKDERERYLEAFSADNWKALSIDHKAGHSLMNCRLVVVFTGIQSTSRSFQCSQSNSKDVRRKIQ